jgi:peptidoglycan hydrolase CwlO-like protein
MALAPPQSKEDWLYATVLNIANQQEAIMATLSELKGALSNVRTEVVALRQDQQDTRAVVTALAGSVDTLISVVGELKSSLSAEEQNLVNEAMGEVAATLKEATAGRAEEEFEQTQLTNLAARAQAAAGGGTPTT